MEKSILFINAARRTWDIPTELFEKKEQQEQSTDIFAAEPGSSERGGVCYADSGFTSERTRELERIEDLMHYLRGIETDNYSGIMIFADKDSVKYYAAFASFLFCDASVPIIIACAGEGEKRTAKLLKRAGKLIGSGLVPNIYYMFAPAGEKIRIFPGTADFGCGFDVRADKKQNKKLLKRFAELSENRFFSRVVFMNTVKELDGGVLFVREYPGMDFSKLPLYGVKAVVYKGLSTDTVPEYLAYECYRRGIPVFAAGGISPEVLYAKVVTGVSIGFSGDDLDKFITEEICGEYSF